MLPQVAQADPTAWPLRVAIVGCPNVGKSSLMNRLLGHERSVVNDIPRHDPRRGRQSADRGDRQYLFVDTAGFRRRGVLRANVDVVGVLQSTQAIRRCDVGVVVLDAAEGLRDMDVNVVGKVDAEGKGIVLAVNKWDGEPRIAHEASRALGGTEGTCAALCACAAGVRLGEDRNSA